jgi:predicted secreted Zn-dependent protease
MILHLLLVLAFQSTDAVAPVPEASERLRLAAPEAAAFPNTTLYGYVVEATNARAIRAEMNRIRPGLDGNRHDATTVWKYRTQFSTIDGRCDPTSVRVTYTIAITLPDLQNRERLSSRDRQAWDRYFAALKTHELNHARIAQRGAELYEASIRSAADCQAGRAAASATNAQINAASAQYDTVTEHGRREGATFPN